MAHDPYYELRPDPIEPPFDAGKTALLTIDLQYLDAHADGWMGRLAKDQGRPEALQERWDNIAEILPNVRRLQDACRAAGMEVMHIRVAYRTQDHRDGQRSLATRSMATGADERDREFLPEVAPLDNEIVINKTSAGAFNSISIDQILRNMGIDRLWVTGIVTEGCVELTSRDAADRGFMVTLVSDGCTASNNVAHEDALQRMSEGSLIKVRSVNELVDQLVVRRNKATVRISKEILYESSHIMNTSIGSRYGEIKQPFLHYTGDTL